MDNWGLWLQQSNSVQELQEADCLARELVRTDLSVIPSITDHSGQARETAERKSGLERLLYLKFLWGQSSLRKSSKTEDLWLHLLLAGISLQFGLFDTVIEVCEDIRQEPIKGNQINSLMWVLRLREAKALRGLGRYEEALEVYISLLQNYGTSNELRKAFLLLTMGKTCHNHLWRLGLYGRLVEMAIRRLKRLYKVNNDHAFPQEALKRYLSICLDSRAFLEFEHRQRRGAFPQGLSTKEVTAAWKLPLALATEVGAKNGELRMRCRSAYAAYFTANKMQERTEAFGLFEQALREIEADDDEIRGHAVRYGQFSDILLAEGMSEQAIAYADRSIRISEWISDWRTYTRAQIRKARIYRIMGRKGEESHWACANAESALKKLKQTHPELEVDIQVERFKYYRAMGNFEECRPPLHRCRSVLEELEVRLSDDLEGLQKKGREKSPIQIGNVKLDDPTILTREERRSIRDAAFADFQLFASLQKQVLVDIDQSTALALDQEARRLHVLFWQDLVLGQGHSIKGAITSVSEDLKKRCQEAIPIAPTALERKKLEELLEHVKNGTKTLVDQANHLTSAYKQEGLEYVSVRETALKAIQSPILVLVNPLAKVVHHSTPRSYQQDFEIKCVPAIFEMVLVSLLQNSLEALKRNTENGAGIVRLGTGWLKSSDAELARGIIEIEDNAGAFEELVSKWNSNSRTGFGLTQASLFFGKYSAQCSALNTRNNTVFRIELPRGLWVREVRP